MNNIPDALDRIEDKLALLGRSIDAHRAANNELKCAAIDALAVLEEQLYLRRADGLPVHGTNILEAAKNLSRALTDAGVVLSAMLIHFRACECTDPFVEG